jgi:hypothetical protein
MQFGCPEETLLVITPDAEVSAFEKSLVQWVPRVARVGSGLPGFGK